MTGKSFKVKFCASCRSSNIDYLITCMRCGLQYVGETSQPLGHWSDIAHWRTDVFPVAEHFNSGAHSVSDMTIMTIELSTSRGPYLWKVKEGRWIRTLETSFSLKLAFQVVHGHGYMLNDFVDQILGNFHR